MAKNYIIKGGKIENEGDVVWKNVELEKSSFRNYPTGKASLEEVETDSKIENWGNFKGKKIKIFLKKNRPWLTIAGIIIGLLGIAVTIYFSKIK